MKTNKPLAVIIGQGSYNDLGLIRSCGEFGMNVIIIVPSNIIIPVYRSRYVVKWLNKSITDSDTLLNTVHWISSSYPDQEIILYPASDICACLIDNNFDRFPQSVIIPHAYRQLHKLMDKSRQTEIARKCNLNVPESITLDLHEYTTQHLPVPCIIKPLASIAGEKRDITICHNDEEIKNTLNHYRSKNFFSVLIQSLIIGNNQEEVAIAGISNTNGDVIINGMVHKIRTRGNGSTVFAKYQASIDLELKKNIISFIRETNFSGIFDIEFIHNESGYHFIECNFRNGAYGYAITSAGFNMPGCYYLLATDKRLPYIVLRDITFMEERSDILNVLDHTITPKKWLRDIISTNTFLWWNLHDMRPMLRIPHIVKRFLGFKNT